jgi:hypothetical protein
MDASQLASIIGSLGSGDAIVTTIASPTTSGIVEIRDDISKDGIVDERKRRTTTTEAPIATTLPTTTTTTTTTTAKPTTTTTQKKVN